MTTQQTDRAVKALERIAMALAAICVEQLKDLDQSAKAKRLSHLGFSNVQIASALGTTPNSINVSLHRARKRPKASQRSRQEKRK
jgi:DNA-directed RNA polymerase specialized sigma24 family protein